MKRQWGLRMACGLLACSLLAGCASGSSGSSASGASPSGENAPEEKTEILLWSGSRADLAFRERKLAEFNEANPDMNVRMEVFTEDYGTTLELAFTSNQAPDIFQVDTNAQYYVERNMIAPIDAYITDEHRQRFGELLQVDQVNQVDGKLYTLAERGITYRLLYNKDIFAQVGLPGPPKTLQELYDYARQITEWGKKDGIYGFAMPLKSTSSVGERVIDQLGYRNGLSTYDYNQGVYDFSVVEPILDTFRQMYQEQILFPGIEGLDIDPLRTQFAAGKIGMYINGNWEIAIYDENGQFPAQCDWDAAPLPGIDTDSPTGRTDIRNAGRSWGISSTCQNPDKAWRYIDFLLSDEYLAQYQQEGYGTVIVPSAAAIAQSPDQKGAAGFAMKDELDRIWPVRPDKAGMKLEGKNAYDVYAEVILGAAETQTALEDLTARYNTGLDASEQDGIITRVILPDFDPAH